MAITKSNICVGVEYTIHWIPTSTGCNPPEKCLYIGEDAGMHWFKTKRGLHPLSDDDIPRRITTKFQISSHLDDSNVYVISDEDKIKFYLNSTSAHAWGQGRVGNHYLLSHGSPAHYGWKRDAIVCTFEDYKSTKRKM